MASDVEVIWVRREQEYFCERGWTAKSGNGPSGKSVGGRFKKLRTMGYIEADHDNASLHEPTAGFHQRRLARAIGGEERMAPFNASNLPALG
jgi:hypothetical protein